MQYKRYAIYYTPEPGPLAGFGAAWLGWDPVMGRELPAPEVSDLPMPVRDLTATPRKYGFHGTLKPPFFLADGMTADALAEAVGAFAATRHAAIVPGLRTAALGRFLALVPEGDDTPINALAGEIVAEFDRFRALASDAELARRRAKGVSAPQEANLVMWGYPFVMEEFRFHMTLPGSLPPAVAKAPLAALDPLVAPLLPTPFKLSSLTLMGETPTGQFREIERYPLAG